MGKQSDLISMFEDAANKREFDAATSHLCNILVEADTTGFHFHDSPYFLNQNTATDNSERITRSIIKLFSDDSFLITWPIYRQLINQLKSIIAIFRLSHFATSDKFRHELLNTLDSYQPKQQQESNIYKILLLSDLSQLDKPFFNWLTELDSRVTTPFILALLGLPSVVGEQAHLNRETLLSFGSVISQQPLDFCFSGLFAVAWMHSSYALRSDKHLFKGYLNQLMRKTLEQNKLFQQPVKDHDTTIIKPKLLVIAEVFSSSHAMSRCYQNYILQLRTKFKTVLLSSRDAVDQEVKQLFDHHVVFSLENCSINKIAELIQAQKADIIYFPSLGMATWTVMLVTYRFAPIQIAATGHPATTLSNAIDYLIGPEFLFHNSDLYSEKLLCIGNELDATHIPPKNELIPQPNIRQDPSELCIAVNAISFKLNAAFLAICRQISGQVERKIKWLFFANQVGIQHYSLQLEINAWLPNAHLIKGQDFNSYLAELNQCDLALSPFPFGGSNSNIDLLRLGIPLVFLTGEEVHSRTDEFYFRHFDLCEGLASDNIENYLKNAIKLVTDDDFRVRLSKKILLIKPNQLILNKDNYNKSDVVEAVSWVFQNHHSIMRSNLRKITTNDRNKNVLIQHFTK